MVVHYNVRPWTAAADASVSQSKTVVLLQMSFLKFQGRELTAATFTGPGPVTCSLLVCVCVCVCVCVSVCVRERERNFLAILVSSSYRRRRRFTARLRRLGSAR